MSLAYTNMRLKDFSPPSVSTPLLALGYYRQSKDWNVNSKGKVQVMPYKNPHDKRRWEREHRAQRNPQRRANRTDTLTMPIVPKRVLDTALDPESKGGWKMILALAVGIASALVGALSAVRFDKAR